MPSLHELLESAQEQPWEQVHLRFDNIKAPQGECVELGLTCFIPT